VKTETNNLKVLVIIPCFNEAVNIQYLLSELQLPPINGINITPLPINDCSIDSTALVISKANIAFLDLPVNLGIGGAVQSGYIFAQENGYDIAVQMDGDGQHPPSELHKILQPLISKECDVVIGSRFIDKSGFQSSGLRRFGINYFKWLNRFLLGIKITDSTSGYRALNKKAIALACDYYPDEYPEPEAIVLYQLNNLKIKEVPVTMRERRGGQSSISSFKSIYYMIKVSLGILFIFMRIKIYGKRSAL